MHGGTAGALPASHLGKRFSIVMLVIAEISGKHGFVWTGCGTTVAVRFGIERARRIAPHLVIQSDIN